MSKTLERAWLWACVTMLLLLAVGSLLVQSPWFKDDWFACDLRWRRREVVCAHAGVNSFHIWNQDRRVEGYRPIKRPDADRFDYRETDLEVHAYPPWQTALFWWYGWLDERLTVALMACLYGICLTFVFRSCREEAKAADASPALVQLLVMAAAAYVTRNCFLVMNYGFLLLASAVALFRLLKSDRQVLAGLAWMLMMIKPQVGILFFWPIVFMRKYRTVVTAVAGCLTLTVAMGLWYGESPIDLILQVPQIGAPYPSSPVADRLLQPVFGPGARFIWMAACFAACGALCFGLRRDGRWYVRCAPVVLFVPIWTYSAGGDAVIQMIWFLTVACQAFDGGEKRDRLTWLVYAAAACGYQAFWYMWDYCTTDRRVFDPAGFGWIFHLVNYAMTAWALVLLWKLRGGACGRQR